MVSISLGAMEKIAVSEADTDPDTSKRNSMTTMPMIAPVVIPVKIDRNILFIVK
ncbi:hypothetical protein FACS1894201_04640 [Bacteroidia bacterium]|nr:hypothetical protein FACS1894201_04640 [Bacteroidia bacterium]